MKHYRRIFTLCLLLMPACATAQYNRQVQELALLSQTWGLLKYYHPHIATGRYDWDSVLVAATKRMLHPGKTSPVQSEISRLLALAGRDDAQECFRRTYHALENKNYTISWIHTSRLLTRSQRSALRYIAAHPYTGSNYYVVPDEDNDSTVSAPHEKPYKEMLMPDVHYRLLSLFRFWNVICYYYPYKYLTDKPWNQVQQELIPLMLQACDTVSYHKALAIMAASINDSHGGLWPWVYNSIAGKYGPGFYFRIIENKVVVTGLKEGAQYRSIRPGSVIDTIDNTAIADRISQYRPYIPASNEGAGIRELHNLVFRSRNTTAIVRGYQPDGSRFTESVDLIESDFIRDYNGIFDMHSTVVAVRVTDSVGYVVFGNLSKENADSILLSLMECKAIIFDLRKEMKHSYGIYHVSSYLLSKPAIYAKCTRPDYSLPGMFRYETANLGTGYETVGRNSLNPYRGKIILLVNECTQSVMEWACMILKTAPDVTVVGSQTAGADGNVTRIVLPGNYKVSFSGLGIYYPDGTQTQRTGIRVDIPVAVTLSDLIHKRDPVLEKAVELTGLY